MYKNIGIDNYVYRITKINLVLNVSLRVIMMNGVVKIKKGNCDLFEIQNLSDDLKKQIRKQLVEICHGEYALTSNFPDHTFEKTIEELVNHRITYNKNRKLGMIGELLLNLLIREFSDMKIVSPFFNLEERSPKKGFDIIAIDSNNILWIIESKAGELGKMKTPTEKIRERINVAKNELSTRLNQDNSQLWLNALNSVRSAMDDTSEKRTVVNILNNNRMSISSKNKNVVLGETVFCKFNSKIDIDELDKLYNSIIKSNKFSNIKLVAIQKETFQAIINYLNTLL